MAETRTDTIVRAIVAELHRRRALLDDGDDLASVTITVKLQVGPHAIRAVNVEEQRIVARRYSNGSSR